jgi:hypothetical protein
MKNWGESNLYHYRRASPGSAGPLPARIGLLIVKIAMGGIPIFRFLLIILVPGPAVAA